ncbi:MAG: BrnA antitoxin family protein [Terriglobia bacterium]
MKKLTKEQERDIRDIAATRDEDIDFSDVPPVLDWSGAEIGKFYRPRKKPVTMRLDSDVIAWLKSDGPGYQTKANGLLRHAMLHFTKQRSVARRNANTTGIDRARRQRSVGQQETR